MATSVLIECTLCNEDFDEDKKLPRSLPCSHYICSNCIKDLISTNQKQCPFCRKDFQAKSANEIMVNRAILDFMTYSTQENKTQKTVQTGTSTERHSGAEVEGIENKVKQSEQLKTLLERLMKAVQTMTTDLDSEKAAIEQVVLKVVEAGDENDCTKRECQKAFDVLKRHFDDIDKKLNEVKSLKSKSGTTSSQDKKIILQKSNELGEAIQKITEQVHNTTLSARLPVIRKEVEESKAKTRKLLEVLESHATKSVREVPIHLNSQTHTNLSTYHNISIQELQSKSLWVLTHASDGKLFAAQQYQGKTKYGRITIKSNNIYLHHLEEKLPPPNSLTLELNEALGIIKTSSRMAFLELKVGTQVLGTLLIRLAPDTQGARHFAHLCTGEFGPSYAQTKLLDIIDKGIPGEAVRCGDYESQNGQGGKALLSGLIPGDEYKRPKLKGTVSGIGWSSQNNACASQFMICTRTESLKMFDTAFGKVVKGLDILSQVIRNCQSISVVSISDCGLVIDSQ